MPGPLDDLLADRAVIDDVARAASGARDGVVAIDTVDADPVPLTNMTTTALARISGSIDAHRRWSLVLKVVQSPDRSPVWHQIPQEFHSTVMEDLRWRTEPELYRSTLRDQLPSGIRLPDVYRVDDIDDAHIAIWMEDVRHRTGGWSLDDYRRAGGVLGRMWGSVRDGELEDGTLVPPRHLRGYFFGRILHDVLPGLTSDETWSHPAIAASADGSLRSDALALAAHVPDMLDRLDELPRGMTHGDACPQNLLRSAEHADTFVAIDWQFGSTCPVGFDVGQVVAGHAESGDLDPGRLQPTFDAVLDGYIGGVRDAAPDVASDDVRAGAISVLTIRSAFTAIPLELLGRPGADALIRDRCRYARFLVDLASTVV
jgi:hypothetical protein